MVVGRIDTASKSDIKGGDNDIRIKFVPTMVTARERRGHINLSVGLATGGELRAGCGYGRGGSSEQGVMWR